VNEPQLVFILVDFLVSLEVEELWRGHGGDRHLVTGAARREDVRLQLRIHPGRVEDNRVSVVIQT